jgi:hypothetical protein
VKVQPYEIRLYQTAEGREPFAEWMRIPGHPDHRSGVMPITIPG